MIIPLNNITWRRWETPTFAPRKSGSQESGWKPRSGSSKIGHLAENDPVEIQAELKECLRDEPADDTSVQSLNDGE
jgi:hypothetical protein